MNRYTEREALTQHGIGINAESDDSLTDTARANGVISVCLGCGTIVTVAPGTDERTRAMMAQVFDTSCCDDADDILY